MVITNDVVLIEKLWSWIFQQYVRNRQFDKDDSAYKKLEVVVEKTEELQSLKINTFYQVLVLSGWFIS